MFKLLHLTLLLCLTLTATDLTAAGSRHTVQTLRDSGISITVQPYFSDLPNRGYVPARITINNFSGREREWSLRTQDTDWGTRSVETLSSHSFTVPAEDTRVFDILIPLGAHPRSSSRSGLVVLSFSGYGVPVDHGQVNLHRTYHHSRSAVGFSGGFTGMSTDLHSPNWGLLMSSHHMTGAAINPDRLPGDWRGLSGFDVIWLSDTAWRRIVGIERRAVLDWLAGGGHLVISRDESDDTPARLAGIPAETTAGDSVSYGFGHIHFFPRQGNNLDASAVGGLMGALSPSREYILAQRIAEGNWQQFERVGLPSIPVVFFSVFLTAFAILVGPINFLVFAKPGQRHRLLWTTPVISLAAGSLLLVLILFQDGTGGTGIRMAIWHHLPEDNRAVLLQEQTSRTGLLVSSHFSLSEPAVLTQFNLNTGRSTSGRRFQVSANQGNGDWFLSRSTQAQFLQSVPATRSRIELAGGNPSSNHNAPALVSTLSYDVDTVFYRDHDGRLWTGGPLVPGTPLTLERCDRLDFDRWWETQFLKVSPVTRDRLRTQKERTGYFYASAAAFNGSETLPSIRWEEQHSLHLGPLLSNP